MTKTTLFRLYDDSPMGDTVAPPPEPPADVGCRGAVSPLAAAWAGAWGGSLPSGRGASAGASVEEEARSAVRSAALRGGRESRERREVWQLLDDGNLGADGLDAPLVVTDLRGLTRAAAALELRHELTRAAQRFELGFGASGRGEDPLAMEPSVRSHWAIVAGAEARRTEKSPAAS